MESIPCMVLHDILKWLLAKTCFDASFMCLLRFVSIRVTFNDLCCWTQRCGLLSRIQLRLTDQSWHTSPNESPLHFEVVFIVCWHQIGKFVPVDKFDVFRCRALVKVVYITVSIILFNLQTSSLKFVYWWHWNKSSNWKAYFAYIYMKFWRDCWQRFVSMLHLWVCFDLFHFVSLLTIYAVECNVVVYCQLYT